jgi:Tfp pilus assembly protein PilV
MRPPCNACRRHLRGYSLVEVLVAAGVLITAISAAAIMARALLTQDQSTGYAVRAINAQEQYARLWQLGVSNITNILPERCSTNSNPAAYTIYFAPTQTTTNIAGVGRVDMLSLRMVFFSGVTANGTAQTRTNDVTIVRPTIR